MRYPRYAVIPSTGRDCLVDCVNAIQPQVDEVLIVVQDAAVVGPLTRKVNHCTFHVDKGEPNISRWWNWGLDCADCHNSEYTTSAKYDVAVINDDAIVPEGWFDAVSGSMRQLGVAAGCSGGHGMPVLHTQNAAPPLATRMQGFAFILAGELGLRADEQFIWYCGDDDLGRRAAMAGGMVMIPGFHVDHLYPNQQVNDKLMSAIPDDMQRYVDKWGGRPW